MNGEPLRDEPLDWDRLATEINFLSIAREERRRTLLCHPDEADHLRARAERLGLADILTIQPSPVCDPGKAYLVDENAMKAADAEFTQSLVRRPWRSGGTS